METGIDFSFANISGAQAKAAGYSFVCRYLASSPGKAISAAQAADYRANGLGIVLVFEDYANQALDGYNQGVADAREALAQANAIGFPADRPLYFAIDFDEADTPLTNSEIYAYLDGAASVIGRQRVGVYGGYYVVMRCMQNGHATWGWQTVAWSGGQVFSGAHIYQNGNSAFGGGADVNQALKNDFGQWAEGTGVKDIMDTNDGIEVYRTALHREPESEAAAAHWNGKKFSDIANYEVRNGPEWQALDAKLKDYPNQVAQVQTLTSELTTANDKITELQKELANQPTPTPVPTPDPTPAPSKLPAWLQSLINFLSGK